MEFKDHFNSLPDDKILDRSNLKQSADNNFKFNENSRKFSKRVENTVDKGENACYEQFQLLPQCFQKASFLEASKGVIVWEWVKVNSYFYIPSLPSDWLGHFVLANQMNENYCIEWVASVAHD